jgi:hypothetical protein
MDAFDPVVDLASSTKFFATRQNILLAVTLPHNCGSNAYLLQDRGQDAEGEGRQDLSVAPADKCRQPVQVLGVDPHVCSITLATFGPRA